LGREGSAGPDAVLAGVRLEGAHGGDHDGGVGAQPAHPALDVEEALRPHVGAESGLRHQVVAGPAADEVTDNRRVAVGDVAEGPGVNDGRGALQRLDQVGFDRLQQQHRHRAGGVQVVGGDLLPVARVADDDAAEPAPEVAQRCGEREHRHDL